MVRAPVLLHAAKVLSGEVVGEGEGCTGCIKFMTTLTDDFTTVCFAFDQKTVKSE